MKCNEEKTKSTQSQWSERIAKNDGKNDLHPKGNECEDSYIRNYEQKSTNITFLSIRVSET